MVGKSKEINNLLKVGATLKVTLDKCPSFAMGLQEFSYLNLLSRNTHCIVTKRTKWD